MTSLNFNDEYVIQKVVTADNTYGSDVDNDNNFERSDYSGPDDFDSNDETSLSNLLKEIVVITNMII